MFFENEMHDSDALVEQYAASFDSMFKKMNIYSRNKRLGLVNENSKYNDRNIWLSEDEVKSFKIFALMMEQAYVETYCKDNNIELNESWFGWGKKDGENEEEKEEEKESRFEKIIKQLPESAQNIVRFIAEFVKKGVSSVKDLLTFIGNAIEKIGNNAIGGLFKALGLIKEFKPAKETNESRVYSYQEYLNESEEKEKISSDYDKFKGKSLEEIGNELKTTAIESENGEDTQKTMEELINDVEARQAEKGNKTNESVEYTIENLIESAAEDSKINPKNIIKYFKENNKFIQTLTSLKKFKNKEDRPSFWGALWGGVKKILLYFHQLVISFVGSYLVEKAIPMILKFGEKIGMTFLPGGWLVILCKICWYTFGYIRILENRYKQIANNPAEEENFFNVKVTLALIMKTINIAANCFPVVGAIASKFTINLNAWFTKWFTSLEPIKNLFNGTSSILDHIVNYVCETMAKSKTGLDGDELDELVKTTWLNSAKEIGHPEMGESVYGKNCYDIEKMEDYEEPIERTGAMTDEDVRKALSEDQIKEFNEIHRKAAATKPGTKEYTRYNELIAKINKETGKDLLLLDVGRDDFNKCKETQEWCKKNGIDFGDAKCLGDGAFTPQHKDGSALTDAEFSEFQKIADKELSVIRPKSMTGEDGVANSSSSTYCHFYRPGVVIKQRKIIITNPIESGSMFFNLIHAKYKGDKRVYIGKSLKDKDVEYLSNFDYIQEVKVSDIDKYASEIPAWQELKTKIRNTLDSEIESLQAAKEDASRIQKHRIEKKIEKLKNTNDRKVFAFFALIKEDDEDKPVKNQGEDWVMPKAGEQKSLTEANETRKVAAKPLMVFSCDIMQGCDTINNKAWRREKPYPMKGAFKSLSVRPAARLDDNDIKDAIVKIMVGMLKTSAQTVANDHAGFGIEQDDDDKYVVSEKSPIKPNEELAELGGTTLQDICDILNTDESNERKLYAEFFDANIGKSKEESRHDAKKYVTEFIIPFIEKEDSDLHEELIKNDKVGRWLFPDGKFDKDIILKDKKIIDALADPMASYEMNSKLTRKQAVGFKDDEKESKKWNDRVKTLVSIIWSYIFNKKEEWVSEEPVKLPPHEEGGGGNKLPLPPHEEGGGGHALPPHEEDKKDDDDTSGDNLPATTFTTTTTILVDTINQDDEVLDKIKDEEELEDILKGGKIDITKFGKDENDFVTVLILLSAHMSAGHTDISEEEFENILTKNGVKSKKAIMLGLIIWKNYLEHNNKYQKELQAKDGVIIQGTPTTKTTRKFFDKTKAEDAIIVDDENDGKGHGEIKVIGKSGKEKPVNLKKITSKVTNALEADAHEKEEGVSEKTTSGRAKKWMTNVFIPNAKRKDGKNKDFAKEMRNKNRKLARFFKNRDVNAGLNEELLLSPAIANTLYKLCCNNVGKYTKIFDNKDSKNKYFNETLVNTLMKKYGYEKRKVAENTASAIERLYDLVIEFRNNKQWKKANESVDFMSEFDYQEDNSNFLKESSFTLLDFESFREFL